MNPKVNLVFSKPPLSPAQAPVRSQGGVPPSKVAPPSANPPVFKNLRRDKPGTCAISFVAFVSLMSSTCQIANKKGVQLSHET
ncbi:MAG: hypothetical protein RKO24_12980 [Candidatus Competibacter sp.]|nr:hypothetical protein [Candidatus Competibacter sp.]